MLSMTGYGSSKKETNQCTVTVELKSVNHRFCEINVRMPRQLIKIEDKLKKKISEYVSRGRVEVFVVIEGDGLTYKGLHIDWNLLDDYYQFINKLNRKYELSSPIEIKDLLSQENLVEIIEKENGNENINHLVLSAMEEAVERLVSMRATEGKQLQSDLVLQIERFNQLLEEIRIDAPFVIKQYESRLEKRIKEYTEGMFDEARILTEVGIFAEKADINEEITRLESHISQFQATIQMKEPIGRKLDFMIQEMNREVNTIGSKANHLQIASKVVDLKTILEKMREQVQNIE